MNRLSDDDVDRIARRVVGKLVVYGLVIVAALWVAPLILITALNLSTEATRGLPEAIRVAFAAAVIAGPIAAIIWAWGRSKRGR
jgi:hypothetical protein